jgi:hypothetical protein
MARHSSGQACASYDFYSQGSWCLHFKRRRKGQANGRRGDAHFEVECLTGERGCGLPGSPLSLKCQLKRLQLYFPVS